MGKIAKGKSGTAQADVRALDRLTLIRRAQAGDAQAREELLHTALPLITSLSRQYRIEGLEARDLIQEGFVGLLRALVRFDTERGVPFSAFAALWIRQALQELRSDFVRPLRLPPKALRQLSRLKSIHQQIYAQERRDAPLSELAEQAKIPLRQAELLIRADARGRSLAEPLDGEIGTLGDLIEDPLAGDAYSRALDKIAGVQVLELLLQLTARERAIIEARYGLDGNREEGLSEIGERLGITGERVRQIENRALTKLRLGADGPLLAT